MSNRIIEWGSVPDIGNFNTFLGEHLAEVVSCDIGSSKNGDEQWNFRFHAIGGEHDGQPIFDDVTFSDAGVPRCKFVFARLGYDMSAGLDLDVIMDGSADGSIAPIVGRRAYITLENKKRKNESTGIETETIKVMYNGYRRTEENGGPAVAPAAATPAANGAAIPTKAKTVAVQSQTPVARTVTPPKVASAAAPAAQPTAAANPAPAGDGLPF